MSGLAGAEHISVSILPTIRSEGPYLNHDASPFLEYSRIDLSEAVNFSDLVCDFNAWERFGKSSDGWKTPITPDRRGSVVIVQAVCAELEGCGMSEASAIAESPCNI